MELWHERLRRLRLARGWSLADAARVFCATSAMHTADQVDSARRQIARWESGASGEPTSENRRAIARMFDLPERDFFPARLLSAEPAPSRLSPDGWSELMAQLRSSRVPASAIEQAGQEVDRLCTEYAGGDRLQLLAETEQWGAELVGLRGAVDLSGMRETYRLLGWLNLLHACLLYDGGGTVGAHRSRQHAMSIARELDDGPMLAWGHEIAAWIALTTGDLPQVVASVTAGVAAAPTAGVAAQLRAQEAKAWARARDRHKTELALEEVRHILDSSPPPENLRNHFSVDPTKASFYAMDAYRVVGDDELANAMADTVIATSTTPTGLVISPMRLAEAELTKAAVRARQGDLAGAGTLIDQALARERQSLPSLAMVAQETADQVASVDPAQGRELTQYLADLASAAS